jgi:hypothetical protein
MAVVYFVIDSVRKLLDTPSCVVQHIHYMLHVTYVAVDVHLFTPTACSGTIEPTTLDCRQAHKSDENDWLA